MIKDESWNSDLPST